MSYILKLIDVFKDYASLIFHNWYVFAVWTVLCVAITSLVFKALGKKQKDKINQLSNKVEDLEARLKEQKGYYEKMETEAWMTAPKVYDKSPVAAGISDAIRKKK